MHLENQNEDPLEECSVTDDIASSKATHKSEAIVFARRSPRAMHVVLNLIKENVKVLLIGEKALFSYITKRNLHSLLPRSLVFVPSSGNFSQKTLEELLTVGQNNNVTQLHVVLDSNDFLFSETFESLHTSVANIIHILEFLVAKCSNCGNDTIYYYVPPKAKRAPNWLHILERFSFESKGGFLQQRSIISVQETTFAAQLTQDEQSLSCDPYFNNIYFYDVFLKTVELFFEAYRNVYNLKVVHIMSIKLPIESLFFSLFATFGYSSHRTLGNKIGPCF